jgi:hypothetical protein
MIVVRSQGKISAMVLTKMKKNAEVFLDMTIRKAIVIVPTYFNYSHRKATIDASTIAGLNVGYLGCVPSQLRSWHGHRFSSLLC